MKKIYIILFLLGTTFTFAQNYLCLAKPAGSKTWGYINEMGEFSIPPKYRKCFPFSDGLAVVLNDPSKQYSFINGKGEPLTTEILSFRLIEIFGFDVQGFINGMVAIKDGDQWGFLDTQGKLAVEPNYDKVTEFNGGYVSGLRDKEWFIISSTGSETLIEDPDVGDVKHFSDGLAPYYTLEKRAGFIDTKGQIVIPAKFQSVGYFVDGLAWAKLTDGKIGYINKNGEWVIQPQFDAAKEFDSSSKMARVRTGDTWGYVNESGEVLKIKLETYTDFSDGLCYGRVEDKVGFFDNTGTWVIKPQFAAVRAFKNGFAAARMLDLWGIIDKTGQWVIPPKFDGIKDMELVK